MFVYCISVSIQLIAAIRNKPFIYPFINSNKKWQKSRFSAVSGTSHLFLSPFSSLSLPRLFFPFLPFHYPSLSCCFLSSFLLPLLPLPFSFPPIHPLFYRFTSLLFSPFPPLPFFRFLPFLISTEQWGNKRVLPVLRRLGSLHRFSSCLFVEFCEVNGRCDLQWWLSSFNYIFNYDFGAFKSDGRQKRCMALILESRPTNL